MNCYPFYELINSFLYIFLLEKIRGNAKNEIYVLPSTTIATTIRENDRGESVISCFSQSIIDNLIARYAAKLINSSLLIAYGYTSRTSEGSKMWHYRRHDRHGRGYTPDVHTIVSFTVPGGPRRALARVFRQKQSGETAKSSSDTEVSP